MVGKRDDAIVLAVPGERFTPFTLAKKLGAKALLESASFARGRDRYSILLLDEAFRLRQDAEGVTLVAGGHEKPWAFPGAEGASAGRRPDILDALEELARQNEGAAPSLPVPAAGVGFLGWGFAARCDTVRAAAAGDGLGIPEAEFAVGHCYLVFDHFSDLLYLVGLNYDGFEVDLETRLAEVRARLDDLDFSHLAPPAPAAPFRVLSDEDADKLGFIAGVESIRGRIEAGDAVQVVLSRRLEAAGGPEPLEGYRRLRSASPSPYLFYVDFGGYALVGASPESLVRLRGGAASIRPIAGTRRRGRDAAEDAVLEAELLADPKERAEHLMLVDLARNDLGRVCAPGSVEVTRNAECERFSHVMHLVSEVEGRPAAGVGPGALLRASFPAGTVSGAPKLKAMEILAGLEPRGRGFYAGAVGYLDASGGLDACIAIRCALAKGGKWYLQAGAGIVHASVPEREWEETNEKLAALRAALAGGVR